ncbi:MAG: D-alanyl-D-alanine carboxypeptidase [Clostridia bacterium]|nr:D-alanyl-D-alanine carboxypeptidase [Clostridia bacterium]
MNRILPCLLAVLLLTGMAPRASAGAPDVSARSAILIDAETGEALFEKAADQRLPMASTTKIMTALAAIESMPLDTVVTVPASAVGVEGSSVYLEAGEKLTLEDLLYALLLASANDAATAIALTVSGSVEDFAALMNEKAAALGLSGTHFTNPHGLDDEEHYTTARDLARLAAAALENDDFRRIAGTVKHTIPAADGGVRVLVNHNKMLRLYDGAIGVKTGFTKRCGRCLVSAAERGGLRLVAVTLSAPDDWHDHTAMLDYGFSLLERVTLAKPGDFAALLPLAGGEADTVRVSADSALAVTLSKTHGTIETRVELPHLAFAPVEAGETLGRVVFTTDGQEIGAVLLTAEEAVAARPVKRSLWQRIFSPGTP